ncbi:MAG: molybdate ABC transporter permease subunit [Bacteroidota bacterium]
MDWTPFWLSLQLAGLTTLCLLPLSLWLAKWLHFYRGRWQPILQALVSLPLVLPPTVLGYYLLLAFQPDSWLGKLTETFLGIQLVFSFPGLVIGSMIFSFPFMMNPLLSGLAALPKVYEEVAATLGKSSRTLYWRVLLPNIKASIIVGAIMTFAHTIGEFGVILMIGGNIPGETRVASLAIYQEVEAMNYATADLYAGILLGFSLLVLLVVYGFQRKSQQQQA